MKIVLSTLNMNYWALLIHDGNHFVHSDARIYGSDKFVVDLHKVFYPDHYYTYAVTPTETTFISEENDQCLTAKEIEEVNTRECLEIHIDSLLNCTLPWRSKKTPQEMPLCSHAWEYDQYRANSFKFRDPYALKNIAKCYPGCNRYEYSLKLQRKTALRDLDNYKDTVEFDFFYDQYEIQVREHVYAYDSLNLVSDFGGWLGLLLGYSILGFYDSLTSILNHVKKKLTHKRQLARRTEPEEKANPSKAILVEPCQDDNILDMPAVEKRIHIEYKVTLISEIREIFIYQMCLKLNFSFIFRFVLPIESDETGQSWSFDPGMQEDIALLLVNIIWFSIKCRMSLKLSLHPYN